MPKKYKKFETEKEIKNLIPKIGQIYKENSINWSGRTIDTNEYYTEIAASIILKNIKKFNNIKIKSRGKSYYRKNHSNINIKLGASNRKEEIFAKRITGLEIEKLGLIKDYQVPLKDTGADKGAGKIDLISYNRKNNTIYLTELKYKQNKETLLKAILEIYTYYKTIDKNKLLKDMFKPVNQKDLKIKPAVLSVPNSTSYKEMLELESGKRPKLKALALALEIKFFKFKWIANEIIL